MPWSKIVIGNFGGGATCTDIGKDLVAMMLETLALVVNIGIVDQAAENFLEAGKGCRHVVPPIRLLTTTIPCMRETVKMLKKGKAKRGQSDRGRRRARSAII